MCMEKKSFESNAQEFESWLFSVTLNESLKLSASEFPYLCSKEKATHRTKPF